MGWLFDGVISSLLVVVRVGVSRETLFLNLEAYSASLCLISFWE